MKEKGKYLFLFLIFLVCCGSDLYTKELATNHLKHQRPVVLIDGYLELRYAENTGVAFSFLNKLDPSIRKPILVTLQGIPSLAITIFIIIFRHRSLLFLLPYLILLTGGVGNLVDRIRYGYVVDFIYFLIQARFSWPIFNVADILICVGIGLLIIQMFFIKKEEKEVKANKKVVTV